MESSHYEQLVQHLAGPNVLVKAEALNIALQLTPTKESREALRKAGLTKQLLRCLEEKSLAKVAASILVNLAQETDFADEVIQLNGIQRVIDNLKENLITFSKLNSGSKSEDTKPEIDEDTLLAIIQLQLLLLSNLSQSDEVKKHLLELHREPEFHGLNFSFMLGWFNHPKISPAFHFFGNILANLSSIKETREFIFKPKIKLLEGIVNSLLSVDPNRRLGCVKTIRNCFFEYESEEIQDYIINPKINLLNVLLKCLLFNVIRGLATDPELEDDLEQARKRGIKYGLQLDEEDIYGNMDQVLEEVDLLIDSFLVITNIDPEKKKIELDLELLSFCCDKIKVLSSAESLVDRVNVLEVCLLKENNTGM